MSTYHRTFIPTGAHWHNLPVGEKLVEFADTLLKGIYILYRNGYNFRFTAVLRYIQYVSYWIGTNRNIIFHDNIRRFFCQFCTINSDAGAEPF